MPESFDVPVDQLLRASPYYFIREVFSYRTDGIHGRMIDFFMGNKYSLVLAPRGHGKSKIMQGIITWMIVNDPNKRVILVSDTDTKAQMFLRTIKSTIENSSVLKEFYGNLQGDRWTDHSMVIAGRNEIHTEPSLLSVGAGSGAVTGMHCDSLFIDDIVSFDSSRGETQRARIKDWYRTTLLPVLLATGDIFIAGCLPTDSKILMSDGSWNNIQDIEIGSDVYSFDKVSGSLVIKKVEDVIYQGTDDIYEVKTDRSTIKANKIHLFLTLEPTDNYISNGKRYKFFDFEYKWKQLQDLKLDDLLLVVSEFESNDVYDGFSSDLCWLFGFMVGDGWVTKNVRDNGISDTKYTTYKVCFASGVYDEIDSKVLDIFKDEFGIDFKMTSGRYYLSTSKSVGKFFIDNGLVKGAKNKEIPDWIFKSSLENRRSFIRGLLDADGYIRNRKSGEDKNNNSAVNWSIEVSSEKLIYDLKLLCSTCGYKTTLIRHRERISRAPNSPKPINSKSWSLGVSFKNELLGLLQNHGRGKFPEENFRFERVKSVEIVGKDDIWDLTVKDTHNFIVEGFVTHNTRYHYSDFYDLIINELEYPTEIFSAINEDGTALCEWLVPLHDEVSPSGKIVKLGLLSIKKALGRIIFALQYSNDVRLLKEGNIFRDKYIQYYDGVFFEGGKIFVQRDNFRTEIKKIHIGGDLAISQQDTAAYSAFIAVGMGEDHKLYVLEVIRDKLTFSKQKEAILKLVGKWNPMSTRLEAVGYQAALVQEMQAEGGLKVVPIFPTRDKVSRANQITGWFENSNIYILKNIMGDLVDELLLFPDGTFKDQVDALVFSITGFTTPGSEMVVIDI